jgi:hypothetical protein
MLADDLEQFKRQLTERVQANSLNAHDGALGFQTVLLDIHWSLLAFFQLRFEEMLTTHRDIVESVAGRQAELAVEVRAAIGGFETHLGLIEAKLDAYIADLPTAERHRLVEMIERHDAQLQEHATGTPVPE